MIIIRSYRRGHAKRTPPYPASGTLMNPGSMLAAATNAGFSVEELVEMVRRSEGIFLPAGSLVTLRDHIAHEGTLKAQHD